MTRLRTANLLAAFAGEVTEKVTEQVKSHPNQTDSGAAALNVIGFWEGCTNSELSRALGLSHTATVRLVDKLEAQGLVESRSGEDRRAVHFYLTKEGEAAVKPILVARCAAVDGYLNVLTKAEEEQLAGLLDKLMRPLATDGFAISHICRLCNLTVCPAEQCPMHAGEHA